jgi:hypothetical protein
MATTPETDFLVIADLTGCTAYLSRSELEHAPAIAGDLLETIVGRLDPPFRLAKFEGDAAFLFVEDGRADGSLLLDAIEASYLAFRRRLRSIDQATSCDCNSCRLAPRLDLKLFVPRPLTPGLAGSSDHLTRPRRVLQMVDTTGPCCDAADAVVASDGGGCACCAPVSVEAT